jgi:hypothetical protein
VDDRLEHLNQAKKQKEEKKDKRREKGQEKRNENRTQGREVRIETELIQSRRKKRQVIPRAKQLSMMEKNMIKAIFLFSSINDGLLRTFKTHHFSFKMEMPKYIKILTSASYSKTGFKANKACLGSVASSSLYHNHLKYSAVQL